VHCNRGGAKVNDVKIDDELHAVSQADFDAASGELKLSSGKKKHAIVEIEG
jgi:tyrosyl-tRNA synthetase